ncbi:MAG: hypothetical protein JSV16_10030, partial [Candidatus Hydrogenedentota bacterium]
CTEAFAQEKKVMFFEAALAPADTMFSTEPSGYSKLAGMLRDSGMLVASMSSGEMTREKLSPYDTVVLHPSPERPLKESEISALVWFVAQKGGALFIHGGTARIVNPLAEIFGISMDTSDLVDTSSAIDESAAGRTFVLSRFPRRSGFCLDTIESISFHGGGPLVLSQDAVEVVTGDEDCFSDNGLYSIGSFPPVAAVAYLGRGVFFVKSGRTMLDNAHIETHQNMEWAKAVFEHFASAQETGAERESSLLGLRSRLSELEETLKVSTEKLRKHETDLTASYKRVKEIEEKLLDSEKRTEDLAAQLSSLKAERDSLSETLATYRSPDTLKIVAIGAGVVVLVVFLLGLLIGRRTVRRRA